MSDQPAPEDGTELPLEERLSEAALAALMGDPYEVGLRVALDDGVAEALPAVARELAFLDRAVATVREGVAGLASAPLARPAPTATVAVVEEGGATPERGAVAALPASAGVRRAAGPMDAVTRAAERVAAEAVPVSTRQAAPSLPEPPATGPREARPREAGRLDWGGVDWGRLSAVPGVAPGVAEPATPVIAETSAPIATPAATATLPMWDGAGQALPSAAPVEQAFASGFAAQAPEQAAAAAPGAAWPEAEPEAEQAERAIEGRLEIDGALLGRFVAEHLAREAGRPPSGMTGFDPLLSPEWAGALQG
jgi:hypothetical protein